MIINLDMSSPTPIYVQLRNEIVMGIGLGKLKIGEGLPTVRQMAQDIGVNTMTVTKAYNILRIEGYIEIDRRHGAKVNPKLDATKEFKEKLENELLLIIAESSIKGIQKKDFLNLCSNIFDNMTGLKLTGGEA
ncbi:GntR family transcriptional regulator [Clostridium cibarium]|uniref:GntR family transcriptional regulator n=1 Tax=Clostridium cibarium TaxID=2762247 RepID=A0ABR8PW57_9CLOT|nr:GntR family transcriptional regulator [Clostridium cibarium]MBD7912370.1 GntR family transcriptional regulator [Clostridium cibarium]